MGAKTVKKSILFNDIRLTLYDYDPYDKPVEGLANIESFDASGNLLWTAEKPVTEYEAYFDMWIDKDTNRLIANTGGGYRHEIDIQTGKVLKSYLVK